MWENQGERRSSEIKAYTPLSPDSAKVLLLYKGNVVVEPVPNYTVIETSLGQDTTNMRLVFSLPLKATEM